MYFTHELQQQMTGQYCIAAYEQYHFTAITSSSSLQGDHPSWKVIEFSKTIFQAWKVMENS